LEVRVLKILLATIAADQSGNAAGLATAIGTSPAMIEALIGELERRGLLQRAGECGSGCTACPVPTGCGHHARGSAWLLTTAGRRYVER
jgi:hypothetical protein